MENRKQIYSAMRDWKRENCPPYSKLNKAELEALVQSLGIPIPAEEPAQARAPKKKKIKPKFDKTPKIMIKPKRKKKDKVKMAVAEAVKLGKKTIADGPKMNNLNLLEGLQGGIMGNIPLDLAPQAPDIPDEPRADRPMGRFEAPVIKAPMGLQVQQANEIVLGDMDLDMDIVGIEREADEDIMNYVDALENVKVKPIEDFGDIPMRFPLEDENGEDIAFVWNSFPEVKLSIEGQRAYGKIFTQGSGVNMKAYVYISRGKRIFELLGELLAVPPAGGLGDDFIIYENDFRRFNDDVLYNMEGQKQDKPVSGKNKKIPQPILDEWERAMKENEGKYDLDFEVAKLMFKMKSGGGMTKQDIKTMADGLLDAMRDELKEAGGDDKKRREIELEYLVPIVELQRILTPEFNKVIKDVLKLRKDLEGEGVDINNLTKEIELGNLRPPPKQEEKKVKKGKSKTGLLVFKQKLYNKKQTNYYVDEFGNVYDDKDKKKYLGRFAKFGPSVIKKMIEDGSKAITYKAGDYTIDPKAEKRTSLEDPKPVAKPKSKKQKGPDMDIDEAVLKGQNNKTAKSTIVNILKALDAKRRVLVLKSVINDNDTYDAIFEDAKTFDDYVEAMDEVEDDDTGQSFYEIFGEKIWNKVRKNYTKL